jgi:hypothetical protein
MDTLEAQVAALADVARTCGEPASDAMSDAFRSLVVGETTRRADAAGMHVTVVDGNRTVQVAGPPISVFTVTSTPHTLRMRYDVVFGDDFYRCDAGLCHLETLATGLAETVMQVLAEHGQRAFLRVSTGPAVLADRAWRIRMLVTASDGVQIA